MLHLIAASRQLARPSWTLFDVSPAFEKVATHYVLLSWVYDAFNELPYLRRGGDYGSAKKAPLISTKRLFGSAAHSFFDPLAECHARAARKCNPP